MQAMVIVIHSGGALALQPQKFLEIDRINTVKTKAGSTLTVTIPLTVAKQFHVHSNPAASAEFIPTEIKLEPVNKISIGVPLYPKGKPYRLKGSTKELTVYAGKFNIQVPLKLSTDLQKGDLELKGVLRYQACNDTICFFPDNLPVSIPVKVE